MASTEIIIALWSVIFSAVSVYLTHTFGGRSKVKQLQKEVNDFQKEFEKATKEKNEKKLEEMKIREPEMMAKMQEMLFLPLKSMVIILPVFFIFIWLVEQFAPAFTIILPFGIHVNEVLSLNVLNSSTYGPRGFFIVVSIVANLVFDQLYTRLLERNATNKTPTISK